MKRKGFCFKQAVSLLLAAALILTAAPQTGMTAFAAENSDVAADSRLLSVDDTLADAGSNDNDTDSDTAQPEDEQDETQLPEDPGQEGKPDDAEEPGEVTEPADEQEGDGEDAADIVGEEEIASENTLAVKLMSDEEPEEDPNESEEYLGTISTESDKYRGEYTALNIGTFERMDLNNDQPWTVEQILEKLQKRKEGTDRFDVVGLWINDTGAASRVIRKDLLNAAVELLNEQNGETYRGIDYFFEKDESERDPWEYMCFSLHNPDTATDDINADATVTLVAGQGVKLMFPAVNFNAEHVTVNFQNHANWDEIKKILEGAGGEGEWDNSPYCLFTLKNGEPELYEDYISYNADCYMDESRFQVNDVRELEADTEYLMVPLKNAASMNVGETRELTPPEGATDVTWKSYTPDIISINTENEKSELVAQKNTGEALYGVTYKEGDVQKARFYRMKVEDPQESSTEYLGYVRQESDEYRGTYTALEIGTFERMDLNNDQPWTEAQILEKLQERQKGADRFDCVSLWINDTGAASRVIKEELVNAAVELLKEQNDEKERWINYIFQKYEPEKESWENMSFSLNNPGTATGDINADVTVTPVPGQGVKLKFPAVNFNTAGSVVVNFGSFANWADIQKCLDGAGGEGGDEWDNNPYYLFMLKSGQPEMDTDYVSFNADCDMSDSRFWVCDLRCLKANTDYLMVPLKNAPSMNVGDTRVLTPPAGATNVTWKSYTPDIISINTKNGKTELAAWDWGNALYGVTYKEGGAQKTRFYRMQVEKELARMEFLTPELTMETGWQDGLQLNFFPADFGCDQRNPNEIEWKIKESKPSTNGEQVIIFGHYDEGEQEVDDSDNPTGDIIAKNPGTATVEATYVPSKNTEKPITAVCTITVKGRLDWDAVAEEVDNMHLYAVSGCDTKLGDVEFPKGTTSKWEWKDPDMSLAPYAGLEGHEFTAICTRDGGWRGEHSLYVSMVRVTGINMQSRMPSGENTWTDWDQWWIPTALEKGDKLSLGFWYNLEGIEWIKIESEDEEGEGYEGYDPVQTAAVEAKLADQYKVEWSGVPNGAQKSDGTYEYTAAVSGTKAEKKTFTVSLKDKANKVVWKASHTLTVTPNPLFGDDNWNLINEAWENKEVKSDDAGKLTGMTLKIKMSKQDYDKWKLKFESMDTGILQLGKPVVTEETTTVEGNATKTTVVTIPCTQKSFGRVWIKVTVQDDDKSSQTYDINLEDKTPTLLSAATQTINKASSVKSVPILVSTSEGFPLAKANNMPDVSIQEVKIGGKDAAGVFELTDRHELPDPQSSIGVYGMNLGLKSGDISGVKTGSYTVKLKFKTTAIWEGNKEEEATASLTVKVTDVKPKVTFKQAGKVNLFYTDDEGAGALQINTSEKITSVVLKNYEDKNPGKNADCHYELKADGGVYKIVRKTVQTGTQPDGSLKKGTLEYTVEGYAGTFKTTFTVATENKAPAIVLSTKSDTLYPGVGYSDSWISMTNKATGESFIPTKASYYVGKGANKTELKIGAFDDNFETQKVEITGSTSGNKYGLFVTNDGNIVSRFRASTDNKKSKKADTINLELEKNNWSNPVAVSYKLQVNTETPKLALGKATLSLNKNADVYRGQQERTTLRLKGLFNGWVRYDEDSRISITGQDEKSKAELKGKDSSLVVQYWDDVGDVIVRLNDNDIAPGSYKVKISVGKDGEHGYTASTVLTVKIVDKTVKQSLKVTAKGSIDVLNREGTYITYTPKISNLTGTVVDGWLEGKDANLFQSTFEDGKLIVKADPDPWRPYSTKITYEVHTVFRVQTENWRDYEISSDNDAKAKPFKIKVKQGKPKLTATAVDGNTLYRQRNNTVEFRLSAMLGKQDVAIVGVGQTGYWNDLWTSYDETNQIVVVGFNNQPWGEIRKNGTYKMKFAVRYSGKAGDVKEAEVTCPIVVR